MISHILKFEAPWCGQCKMLDKYLAKVTIPVKHINIEEDEDAAEKYNIRNLPTMLFMNDTIEVARFSGIMTTDAINQKIIELGE